MIKGIIFDMDGVISDTQKFHSQVESELLARYGIQIPPPEITRRYAGVRTVEFFDQLLKNQKSEYDLNSLVEEKWATMEKLASLSVEVIDGSLDLIKRLSAAGYALAVASSSNSEYVRHVLTTLGVITYFSNIVAGDMISRGKPDSESFLLAATKINIIPEQCLVIEDGISGMKAAARAGMKCIGLVANYSRDYPTEYQVTSLAEITPAYLKKIK
jgi:HAD superfamily hydrolase (TIGR01509 family)